MDKFRDIYREAIDGLQAPPMDAGDVRDELGHRRRVRQRRRYLAARGCAAAVVFLLCGVGTAAAKNYRTSLIRVEDSGVVITGGQNAEMQEKARRVVEEDPENASFLKMGGVFPIEEDTPEEAAVLCGAFPVEQEARRAAELMADRAGAGLTAGTGGLAAESLSDGAGFCVAAGLPDGTGSRVAEGPSAVAGFGVEADPADLTEARKTGESLDWAESREGEELPEGTDVCEVDVAACEIREYDSFEEFRESESVTAVAVDQALFQEEFTWENVVVVDDGRTVLMNLSSDTSCFSLIQQNHREDESYSTGISYGGKCGNKRSFTSSQGLNYVLFDSLDDDGQVVSVHGVISVNGWDLSVTFENFAEGIVERVLDELDLSVYY